MRGSCTIDIDKPGPVTDQTLGGFKQIPHANAQANLVDDFIGVFYVDGILDRSRSALVKVLRRYLNQILNRRLFNM